jgi:hypothetical protein
VDEARKDTVAYYGENADYMVNRILVTPSQIRSAITSSGDLGADEVMLYCWSPDPEQVDRIADIVS